MSYILKFLIASLFIVHPAIAQESTHTAKQINPTQLPPEWWTYFDVGGDELKKRVEEFYRSIDEIPPNLSEGRRNQGKILVDEIKSNFGTYINVY